jgi:hypothetical protein
VDTIVRLRRERGHSTGCTTKPRSSRAPLPAFQIATTPSSISDRHLSIVRAIAFLARETGTLDAPSLPSYRDVATRDECRKSRLRTRTPFVSVTRGPVRSLWRSPSGFFTNRFDEKQPVTDRLRRTGVPALDPKGGQLTGGF